MFRLDSELKVLVEVTGMEEETDQCHSTPELCKGFLRDGSLVPVTHFPVTHFSAKQ